jgi:predicted RNase H-like HicB family nuclease
MDERSMHAEVHYEDGSFWANLTEWPNCFASGESIDELMEALCESISMCITPNGQQLAPIHLRIDKIELRVRSDREPRQAPTPRGDGPLPAPPRSRSALPEWGPFRFRRR